jgi:hypothetical protein
MFIKINTAVENNTGLLLDTQRDVKKITTEVKTSLKTFSENFE